MNKEQFLKELKKYDVKKFNDIIKANGKACKYPQPFTIKK